MSVFTGMVTKSNLKLRSQAFSGTDLDNEVDNPGIVYPIQVANKDLPTPSISSIVDHEYGDTILAHSEYRLVINDKNNLACYVKGRCFSIVYNDTLITTQSQSEEMLGIVYNNVAKESYIVKEIESPNAKEFFDLEELLANLDYEPEFIIDSKNLKEKVTIFDYQSLFNTKCNTIIPETNSKKPTRAELEKEIRRQRTELKKLYKELKIPVDDNLIYYLNTDLKDFTLKELHLVYYELEDYLADIGLYNENCL